MKLLAVYIGAEAQQQTNLRRGLERKIWGFTDNGRPQASPKVGDYFLLGSMLDRGGPRVTLNAWNQRTLKTAIVARLTSEIKKEDEPFWEDETANNVLYPYRFRFDDIVRLENIPLGNENSIPQVASDALRIAGQSSRAQLIECPDSWIASIGGALRETAEGPAYAISGIDEIYAYLVSSGFTIQREALANYFAALRSKPFVILAGISGTGKSKLVRLFAEAVGATPDNGRFQMVPVRPDWNDSSELLGFFDLENKFQPGALIPVLLRAHADQENPIATPHFVCLDEMNLARVEHYFSDFLSILESRRRADGQVVTDDVLRKEQVDRLNIERLSDQEKEIVKRLRAEGRGLGVPNNIYFIGTVNMDETTHPFSRKVLDRANTIEFNHVNLDNGFEAHAGEAHTVMLENHELCTEFLTLSDLSSNGREEAARTFVSRLSRLNLILEKGGFQVGYRIRDEGAIFSHYAQELGLSVEDAYHTVVLQKILPRVQGSTDRIRSMLGELLAEFNGSAPLFNEADYPQTLQALRVDQGKPALVRKIAGMLLCHYEDGFCSFWTA